MPANLTASIKKTVQLGLEKLALALALLAALCMTSIVGIIVTSVTMRKLINSPLYFTEEVVGLLLSVSLFLGLPMVTLKASHVRVSILATYLEGWKRYALSLLASLVGIAFCTWITIEAIPWLEFAMRLDLKTETSRVLLYPWMSLLPASIFLTGVIFAARLFGVIENKDGNTMPEGKTT